MRTWDRLSNADGAYWYIFNVAPAHLEEKVRNVLNPDDPGAWRKMPSENLDNAKGKIRFVDLKKVAAKSNLFEVKGMVMGKVFGNVCSQIESADITVGLENMC